jgi:prepilin-type N-terminal cleavage/methylation domain-containing protein
MPILSVGSSSKLGRQGVTLLEMLVVVAIVSLIVGVSYPSASAGLDSIRLATTGDDIATFLNSAVNRVERRQQAVEVIISPAEGRLSMYSAGSGYISGLKLADGITIEKVLPENPEGPGGTARSVILIPGATMPAVGVQFANRHGARRIVRIDPMTGFPRVESVNTT